MSGFSDFDTDAQPFAKKQRPIGWFFAGIGALATLTITFGYYMPLSGAQETLAAEHEKLAQKSRELDNDLKTTKKTLQKTEEQRANLRTFVDAGAKAADAHKVALGLAKTTAENELKKFISAKLLTVEAESQGLIFTFSDKMLFRGKTSRMSPRARRPLCKAVSSLTSKKDWSVQAISRAPSGDKKYWETAGERSANLGSMLLKSCKLETGRVVSGAERISKKDKLEAKTTIIVGPSLPPLVDFSKAPKAP